MACSSASVSGSEAVAFWISWPGWVSLGGLFVCLVDWIETDFILHPDVVGRHVVCAVGDQEDAGR